MVTCVRKTIQCEDVVEAAEKVLAQVLNEVEMVRTQRNEMRQEMLKVSVMMLSLSFAILCVCCY